MKIKDIIGAGKIGAEVAKQAGKIIKEPVANLTNPATNTVGQRFADLLDLVFTPVEMAKIYKDHKIDAFRDSLNKKIDAIPEDKRVLPPLNVVGPALEASKYYIENEVLREMFAELISSSMNSDKTGLAHPSFAEIIKQLSPLDAKLLSDVSESSIRNEERRNLVVNGVFYSVGELHISIRSKVTTLILGDSLLKCTRKDFGLQNEMTLSEYEKVLDNVSVALDNLTRLNLVVIEENFNTDLHEQFRNSMYMESFLADANATIANTTIEEEESDTYSKYEVKRRWYTVKLTKFGISFCDIVLPDALPTF